MIEQLKTIRHHLEPLKNNSGVRKAVDALTQLEAMVGEPVADINVRPSESGGTIASVFSHKLPVGSWLLYRAAPAAQQYEAGDVASAAAQGFRDGVASVTQQEPVAWMGIPVMPGRYKEAVFCSDKDLASQWDYSGHTGLGRLIVTPLYATPAAQQPQELQDIEQYRLQIAGISTAAIGYWKESDSIHPDYDTPALRDVAKLYAKYDELYKAQQPQYEAGDMASAAAQGFRDGVASVAQQPQAYDQTALELCEVCGWKTLIPGDCCLNCERDKPQTPQAEAVPSDVVRDAELGRQMREAIGNEALTRFIEKHGEPVPLQQRIGELEAALKLAYEALKQSHNHMMFAEACGAVTVFDSRSVRDCIEAIEKACAAIAAQGEKP